MKVLYIDDSPLQIRIVGIYLKNNTSLELVPAISGKEGIEKARLEEPDIILLDHDMPVMNGEDALKELKSDIRTREIPVIMFTSSDEPWLQEKLIGLGAAAFLKKPHGIQTLTDTIMKLSQVNSRNAN